VIGSSVRSAPKSPPPTGADLIGPSGAPPGRAADFGLRALALFEQLIVIGCGCWGNVNEKRLAL
jgi:hypothetical protein